MIKGAHNAAAPVGRDTRPDRPGQAAGRKRTTGRDTVEISEEARLLGGDGPGASIRAASLENMEDGISRVRTEIDARLRRGFYDSDEVVRQVADRILDLLDF